MPPVAPPPPDTVTPPDAPLPPGACDAHVHLVAGSGRFPLWPGRVEDPAPGAVGDWLARYRAMQGALGLSRGVVVHSILHGADNAITLEAVRRLGRRTFRAVALVPDDAPEALLDALADGGAAGVRLNYVHGGILGWEGAMAMAPRLAARGMHIQMLMNAHRHLADIAAAVRTLPVPVVFDHLGWPDLAAGPAEPGFTLLRDLVAEGHAWVKLSGLYRLCAAPWEAADAAVAALVEANPDRCLWGSDWPHLMLDGAAMPDAGALLNAFLRAVPGAEARRRVLVDTPAALYGF
jgi:predicted TIM-barrel fold metal-dependent hydrolase